LHLQSVSSSLDVGEMEFGKQSWHTSKIAPTATEYFPAMHSLHCLSPANILNVPAIHSTHTVPFAPVDPALQMHFEMLLLAAGEFDRNGHD